MFQESLKLIKLLEIILQINSLIIKDPFKKRKNLILPLIMLHSFLYLDKKRLICKLGLKIYISRKKLLNRNTKSTNRYLILKIYLLIKFEYFYL